MDTFMARALSLSRMAALSRALLRKAAYAFATPLNDLVEILLRVVYNSQLFCYLSLTNTQLAFVGSNSLSCIHLSVER